MQLIYESERGKFSIAEQFHAAGLNIVPLHTDGSKSPSIRWREWTQDRYPWFRCQHHFTSRGCPRGIGILCGVTSGNLEVLDFDCDCRRVFPCWADLVEVVAPGLLRSLPIVRTPKGGCHVYYRCSEIEGNRRLAETDAGENIIIETRGQGGLVAAPGSPPETHPSKKPYRLLSKPS